VYLFQENKLLKKKDKPKVYAQDRLQKYKKKDINQIEVSIIHFFLNIQCKVFLNKKFKCHTHVQHSSRSCWMDSINIL
jgi:hypothetical protein